MERFEMIDHQASELKYGAGRLAAILAVASVAMIFMSVYDMKLFRIIDFNMMNFWTLGFGIFLLTISIIGFLFARNLINEKTAEKKDHHREALSRVALHLGTTVDDSGTELVLAPLATNVNRSE